MNHVRLGVEAIDTCLKWVWSMCYHHRANVECAFMIYLLFHSVSKPCRVFYWVSAEWWGRIERSDPNPPPPFHTATVFKQASVWISSLERLKGSVHPKYGWAHYLIYLFVPRFHSGYFVVESSFNGNCLQWYLWNIQSTRTLFLYDAFGTTIHSSPLYRGKRKKSHKMGN